ncbi:MAG: phosphoenolpyruvate carboxykinase, partial [Candidatus Aureabacteria bacterium]|nr:phosphoenolpyruvate carboxykinase [Candidatus Auribacterota bacterium]
MNITEILKLRLGADGSEKLMGIDNPPLREFIAATLELCDPARVFLSTDTPDEIRHLRESAVRHGEETPLAIAGHTYHFDNPADQGRDKKNTGILVPPGMELGRAIETKDRDPALEDIRLILNGIMRGKEAYVCFFCLGPARSEFSIPCVQITDSSYVAHSE